MIIWVASFPRSGNTFLRIVLHRLYGVRTSVVYDVDGVAERLGEDTVGYAPRPRSLEAMREASETYFVKTHRQRDGDVDDTDKAICLVRDGRDALVSWARLSSEGSAERFETALRAMILRDTERGTGSWGANVLSWRRPPAAHRIIMRYEDLVAEPRDVVGGVMASVAPELRPRDDVRLPTFDDLRQVDSGFFRRGANGSHRDELPRELHELFWSRPDNVAAMELLGHRRD